MEPLKYPTYSKLFTFSMETTLRIRTPTEPELRTRITLLTCTDILQAITDHPNLIMASDIPSLTIPMSYLTTFSVPMLKQRKNVTTLSFEMKNKQDMENQTTITDFYSYAP